MRISLGIKLNSIISSILIISLAALLWFATDVFKKDNRNNINSLNAAIAKANAEKVRAHLENIISTMLSMGKIVVSSKKTTTMLEHFYNDASIFSVSIFSKKNSKNTLKAFNLNPNSAKAFDLNVREHKNSVIELLPRLQDIYLGEIKIFSKINKNDLPILYIAVPFIQNQKGDFTSIIVAAIDKSSILKMFERQDLYESYLVDNKGRVIAHPDSNIMKKNTDFAKVPIVDMMLRRTVDVGQQKEFLDQYGVEQLGAYALVGIAGIGVISQVSKDRAYEATQALIKRSFLLSVIVLIFSIILIYLFSQSITKPLNLLVEMTKKITQGIYKIRIKTKTKDEIGDLATAFENMADGLEQRERLKNTFGKFVNKELAEQALKGELTLGGEKKQVTILFSDIRNFTKIADKMDPEEVLTMLNDYMSTMVDVITGRGGVVDKFIGDAIMAVWGAPITRDDDPYNAVVACLEMRQALYRFNERRKKQGKQQLLIGMGLNTGYVIAGNMGSSEKMEYTVLGDTVNMASRVEAKTKDVKTDILISGATYEYLHNKLVAEACDDINIKGKDGKFILYKVLGIRDDFGILQSYGGNPFDLSHSRNEKVITGLETKAQLWLIRSEDNKYGPMSEDEVRQFFSKNKDIYEYAEVSAEGSNNWKPAWQHKNFERRDEEHPQEQTDVTIQEMNEKIWYISQRNQIFGPFSFTQIQDLLENGTVYYSDVVWRNGWNSWKPIHSMPGFDRRD